MILHHYDFSNYSEGPAGAGLQGAGLAIGDHPPIAPKLDLTPLTGGYRHTPVLQIGADIYCDTALIVRELGGACPNRRCSAASERAGRHHRLLGREPPVPADVLYVSGNNMDVLPPTLQADRARMRGLPEPDEATMRRAAARSATHVRPQIAAVESMLGDDRAWIAGDAPTIADLAVYHALWFITARTERLAHELAPYGRIRAWMARVRAFGHGTPTPIGAQDALAAARAATPEPSRPSSPQPEDPRPGGRVRIRADDYGRDAVDGELAFIDDREVAIRRADPAVGDIVVHFPRLGYDLRPL